MQTRLLVTYTIQTIIVLGLLFIISIVNNNHFFSHIVLVQQAFANTPTSILSTSTTEEREQDKNSITLQGIISSAKNRINDTQEIANILLHRQDGKIYTGILTFTASRPVEIGLLHKVPVDKDTISLLNTDKFGKILIRNTTQLNGTVIHSLSLITPDYSGVSTPYFSASIPFVASSVGFRSPVGEPFIVIYEVSAKVVQPKIYNNITSAISDSNTANTTAITNTLS